MIHRPTTPGAIVYSDGKPPNNEGRGYYQVDANGKEVYLPDGITPGQVFWDANGEYNQDGQQMGNEFVVGDDGKPIAFQWVPTQVPVGGSTLLQSYVTVYRAVNQETHKDVIVNGGTPMRDDTGTIYNQAVDENGKITFPFEVVAGFVNPGSSILKVEQALATNSAKGLVGKEFEEFLTQKIGGNGSFSRGGRDFDGGIGNRWWEAKSGEYWDMIMSGADKFGKFRSDMGARLDIATKNGATYELYSNTPIPQIVKDWLTKKGINYTEL